MAIKMLDVEWCKDVVKAALTQVETRLKKKKKNHHDGRIIRTLLQLLERIIEQKHHIKVQLYSMKSVL